MPWFKVHDSLWDHPKARAAGLSAIGLWAAAGSWSAGYRTTGFIPAQLIRPLGGTPRLARRLVAAGLWREVEGGYQFHQWRRWQDGDYRPNIRRSIREAVMERDEFRCVFCGSVEDLSLDHIARYADDGPDTEDNLRVLCMPCNHARESV